VRRGATIIALPKRGARPCPTPAARRVAQVGQGAIEDRSEECLGRSARAIILLLKLWEQNLRALQEGREPARWRYPGRLERRKGV